jgi:hypothetical protein
MSLAKLAAPAQPHPQPHSVPTAGYAVATVLLALLGLGLLVFLQAVTPPGASYSTHACVSFEKQQSRLALAAARQQMTRPASSNLTAATDYTKSSLPCAGPGRVMGIIAVLIYGIMACLSTLYPTVGSMWVGAVWLVVLGTAVAAVVGLLVGWLVMPSLASDEVSTVLQWCGRCCFCVSGWPECLPDGHPHRAFNPSAAGAPCNRRQPCALCQLLVLLPLLLLCCCRCGG